MMPTIRIDDDVFESLQSLAKPFIDTPNSVLRQLLQEQGALKKSVEEKGDRASRDASAPRRGSRTAQAVYEDHLLFVLGTKFNGRASKRDATIATLALMKKRDLLPSDGNEVLESTGETKAENTVAWGRNALKDAGLIAKDSPRGEWELTAEGLSKSRSQLLKARLES